MGHIPTTGLVGYWPLGTKSLQAPQTLLDEVGSNNGLSANVPSFATDWKGSPNRVMTFDGSDYINIPDNANQDTGAYLTVSLWMISTVDVVDCLLATHDVSSRKWSMQKDSGNKVRFYIQTASGTRQSVYIISLSQWYHIVGTYDKTLGSARNKLYINGNLEASTAGFNEDILAGDEGIAIGTKWNDSGIGRFVGNINNVRFYNRALSLTEVSGLYQAELYRQAFMRGFQRGIGRGVFR